MPTIERRNPSRCRQQYSADLYVNGEKVGHVERGFVQGGYHAGEYRATVDGITIASARTLRDVDDELREHFHASPEPAFDLSAMIDHALTVADRAASAKADLIQSRKATEDGARWLRERAQEKLRETIEVAEAALVELDRSLGEVTP